MNAALQAVCPWKLPASAAAPARLYGLLDFHKNCEIYRNNALELSGVPIYYHRCPACRFIFTTALDHFTNEDFKRFIYNEQYPLIDPDYQEAPAAGKRQAGDPIIRRGQAPAGVLDYGGGNGTLASLLREAGFPMSRFLTRLFQAFPKGQTGSLIV